MSGRRDLDRRDEACYKHAEMTDSQTILLCGKVPERNDELPDALEGRGYRLERLGNGEETLRRLKSAGCCELIVVGEPADISSRALLSGIQRRFPDQKAVLLLDRPEKGSPHHETFLDLSGREDGEVIEAIAGLLAAPSKERRGVVLLGESDPMERIRRIVEQVAPTPMTVLLTGESGTGKDVVARLVHERSLRSERPFVAVNCAALPEGVLESELFGHERGAFTGATGRREGRFELAHEGTLFLDEIGDMPVQTQAKLLRVLEEKRFLRVGGVKDVVADVRLIAATNSDLEEAVHEGRFRKDLFYRINVIQIHIPPLRERREDIPILIDHFAAEAAESYGLEGVRFSPEALDYLSSYHWPGNVRQLKNLIEKVAILEKGKRLGLDQVTRFLGDRFSRTRNLPVPAGMGGKREESQLIYESLLAIRRELAERKGMIRGGRGAAGEYVPPTGADYGAEAEIVELDEASEAGEKRTAADFEREAIRRALQESGGNRRRAAEILQIGERTLYRKLKQYGIT